MRIRRCAMALFSSIFFVFIPTAVFSQTYPEKNDIQESSVFATESAAIAACEARISALIGRVDHDDEYTLYDNCTKPGYLEDTWVGRILIEYNEFKGYYSPVGNCIQKAPHAAYTTCDGNDQLVQLFESPEAQCNYTIAVDYQKCVDSFGADQCGDGNYYAPGNGVSNYRSAERNNAGQWIELQGVPAVRARFDSDAGIAAAWDRLRSGSFTKQDIQFLKHEIAEAWHMRRHGSGYSAAHDAADLRYPAP